MPAPNLHASRRGAAPVLAVLALMAGGMAAAFAATPAASAPATAATTQTDAGSDPVAPCVAAGAIAVVAPHGQPVPSGPAVAAAVRSSTSAATDSEPDGVFEAENLAIGAAGCVDAAGRPGGTSVATDAWSLFGGAVTGGSLSADLVPSDASDGSRWHLRAAVDDLRVAGSPATLPRDAELAVGTWGILTRAPRIELGPHAALRWWSAALELRIVREHGGLPVGTRILAGFAAADRAWAPPPPAPAPSVTTTTPVTTTTAVTTTAPATTSTAATPAPARRAARSRHAQRKPTKRKPANGKPAVRKGLPLRATPALGGSVYDFPVAGVVSWGDTYGGARSDVSGGWHHGDDLFAGLGAPVVAVADGTVFAVGWNEVGGWRLWLADDQGNEFYYAHLSGYTALARNNHRVKRGQVLAFVGNTGDAFTTSDHLHFEVHPNGLLYLGYDGAVDPSGYLARWQQPDSVKAPPPVALPAGPASGLGVAANYRRLLDLRAPKHPPHKALHAAPTPERRGVPATAASTSTANVSTGNGVGLRRVAAIVLAVFAGVFCLLLGLGRIVLARGRA